MLTRALSALAFWRARRLTALAEQELNLTRRATLRDQALIWSNREAWLEGLLSTRGYATSTRMLKAAIKRRRNRSIQLVRS